MAIQYDAIVIGGGHNGLTCGAYLARAGLRTIVLERRSVIGGAAVSEQVFSGFTFSTFSYLLGQLHPTIIADLELHKRIHVTPTPEVFCPIYDRDYFMANTADARVTQDNIARFSKKDAALYPAFLQEMEEIGCYVRRLATAIPFDPTKWSWRDAKDLATAFWQLRRARKHLYRLIDLAVLSCDDFLSHWFENDVVKGYLSYGVSIGSFAGPRTPGSALALVYDVVGRHKDALPRGHVFGGMGSVTRAMAESASRFGMTVERGDEVTGVTSTNGRVRAVQTASGKEYTASIVVSNIHPKILFGKLVRRDLLPAEFVATVDKLRTFSTAWKINIACEEPPRYKAFHRVRSGSDTAIFAHIGPDVDYLDAAYLDARRGWYSAKPFVSTVSPSLIDDTLAPNGKHAVHLFGGHAPYELSGGDWKSERDDFVRSVLQVVDEAAPGFSSGIIGLQLLLPMDIERDLNIPHGHIFHGEMSLDQMFFKRPFPHFADYRTPIKGLYQCGSSCHPGGGVTGIPGYNAARIVLSDRRLNS